VIIVKLGDKLESMTLVLLLCFFF